MPSAFYMCYALDMQKQEGFITYRQNTRARIEGFNPFILALDYLCVVYFAFKALIFKSFIYRINYISYRQIITRV